jgi:hypothetical protein
MYLWYTIPCVCLTHTRAIWSSGNAPPALNCEVLGSTPDHGRYKDRNLGGSARQAWVQAFCLVQDRQPFCCGEFLHCPFSMELALSAASLPVRIFILPASFHVTNDRYMSWNRTLISDGSCYHCAHPSGPVAFINTIYVDPFSASNCQRLHCLIAVYTVGSMD